MADLWSHLFDNNWRQRVDIERTRQEASLAHDEVSRLARRLEAAEERADRLELAMEGLLTWLELKGVVQRDELTLIIQRIDLADGVEDGKLGPDRSAAAPPCPQCSRPVNPRRPSCVYCGATLTAAPTRRTRPPRPKVVCRSCADEVPEDQVYFSELGMVCQICYSG